ncbi:GTPase HflX [Actinotignum urinale]|uniref:GTPase HflX n=1 Tax=Actinotignum urinale TaxID=190146 RepID=UPI00389AFFE2
MGRGRTISTHNTNQHIPQGNANIESSQAAALQENTHYRGIWAGRQIDRDERASLQRVEGLQHGVEREEGIELEYRKVRLERVVLVGIYDTDRQAAEESLRELAALADTAGSTVLDGLIQRRDLPDKKTYLGKGKAQELSQLVHTHDADTVIVDTELAPSQRRELENVVGVKVIDRTALILDIFARHAKSKEGKAQVELAQLEYLLPRLRGWGESMSRQAGGQVAGGAGIGSRGPGETQLELDRRRIRTRMAKLRKDIKKMEPARKTRRAERCRTGIASVVVAGYTNAGKSSLLNRITGAGVLVENALFATLDPTVRHSITPNGREFTIADTVGFVRNLPTQLVEAFRSTLEEVAEADVILHVVDASHADPVGQVRAVHEVFAEIDGALNIPEIIVLSKVDIASEVDIAALRSRYPNTVPVSSVTGEGLDDLMQAIEDALPHPDIRINVIIPYDRGSLVSRIVEEGELQDELEYTSQGTRVHAYVTPRIYAQIDEAWILS